MKRAQIMLRSAGALAAWAAFTTPSEAACHANHTCEENWGTDECDVAASGGAHCHLEHGECIGGSGSCHS